MKLEQKWGSSDGTDLFTYKKALIVMGSHVP